MDVNCANFVRSHFCCISDNESNGDDASSDMDIDPERTVWLPILPCKALQDGIVACVDLDSAGRVVGALHGIARFYLFC